MTTPKRTTARSDLAALLSTALVGTGKPVEAVYDYQPADFENKTPVVTVSSGGSMRTPWTMQGNLPVFVLYVHIFVLYSDADTGWDEEDAEDRLDLIEESIADVITANRKYAGHWSDIRMEDRSSALSVMIGGHEYRTEVLSYVLQVP